MIDKVINEPLVLQSLYRAMVDPVFATSVFSRLPRTDQTFGDYIDLAKAIHEHYRKYDTPLSKDSLLAQMQLNLKHQGKDTTEAVDEINVKATALTRIGQGDNYSNDRDINHKIEGWARNILASQLLQRKLNGTDDISDPAVIQSIVDGLKEAMTAGSMDDLGESVSVTMDSKRMLELFSETQEAGIPLGWADVDKLTSGGLAPGEMGLVLAESGSGKTASMINIASQYVRYAKKDVLYIALEERIGRVSMRAYRTVFDQGLRDLTTEDGEPDTNKFAQQLKQIERWQREGTVGNFEVFASKPQVVSPALLERILQNYATKWGHYPDVLVVDYPDLMDNPHLREGVNEYRAAGMLYEDLRRIAGQYKCVLWVASQTGRGAGQQEVKNAYAIEGSKQKLNVVELCITLNRTPEEFDAGFVRFYVDKVRNPGEDSDERMLRFKVVKKSVRYVDETPEDREAHDAILSQAKGDQFEDYKKPKISDAQAKKRMEEASKLIAAQLN